VSPTPCIPFAFLSGQLSGIPVPVRRCRPSPCPGFPFCASLDAYHRPAGAYRVSQVLVYFSSDMPRPEDSGRPSSLSPNRDLCVDFRGVKHVVTCISLITKLYQTSGSADSPVAYLIRCVRFAGVVQSCDLRPPRNTRYGWLATPYPTGTFTLQEAPSFAWRTNAANNRL
jgi:hypothetical protein